MTSGETGAAGVRRLSAEIQSDRRALGERTDEVRRFSTAAAQMTAEQLGATALALERAYTSLEAILERVARALEGTLPLGDDWHRVLLQNAGLSIEKVRPAVLAPDSVAAADELRRFRHFIRHAYGAPLSARRVADRATEWLSVFPSLNRDLDSFESFLRELAEELER